MAAKMGLSIERMRFELASEIDLAGLIGASVTGRPDFRFVDLRITVHANANASGMGRPRSEPERRYPVFQLCTRSGAPVRTQWT